MNGHNHAEIKDFLDKARLSKSNTVVLIANTIKGKGVSLWKTGLWHYRTALNDEFDNAMKELNG